MRTQWAVLLLAIQTNSKIVLTCRLFERLVHQLALLLVLQVSVRQRTIFLNTMNKINKYFTIKHNPIFTKYLKIITFHRNAMTTNWTKSNSNKICEVKQDQSRIVNLNLYHLVVHHLTMVSFSNFTVHTKSLTKTTTLSATRHTLTSRILACTWTASKLLWTKSEIRKTRRSDKISRGLVFVWYDHGHFTWCYKYHHWQRCLKFKQTWDIISGQIKRTACRVSHH